MIRKRSNLALTEAVAVLKEAAIKTVENEGVQVLRGVYPKFDIQTKTSPKSINPDAPMDVPVYGGPDCPHVGNGKGPAA